MAAARAEARRKAILARGNDRLAKLTTSARGEDAPAYLHDDPPLPNISSSSRNFLGEDSGSDRPTPSRSSPSPTPPRNPFEAAGLGAGPAPDPSVWTPEQQQQFLQALMGAPQSSTPLPQSSLGGGPSDTFDPSIPPVDNPLAAMLFPQGAAGQFPGANPFAAPAPPKQQTRLQKLMPLLHLVAVWSLLAYFVLWKEPQVFPAPVHALDRWRRWADLGTTLGPVRAQVITYGVQAVPFFWAFTTLQIALHSLRIFSGFDAVKPPTLLAIALPHLPSPLPSIIVNSLKYLQMGSLFLDDIALVVVGLGLIVYISGLISY